MRRHGWVVLAAVLAGCTSGFPGGTVVLTEFEVGELGPGGVAVHNFSLAAPVDYVLVGFRTGPSERAHVVLRAPDGTRFDTQAGDPPRPCVVQRPAVGAWAVEVATDALDGHVGGGKFTVRTGSGATAAPFTCADDVFPGRGRNVTLAWFRLDLEPGATGTYGFAQPLDLASLAAGLANATANATVQLVPPTGAPAPGPIAAPPTGDWEARVTAEGRLENATLAVFGLGR